MTHIKQESMEIDEGMTLNRALIGLCILVSICCAGCNTRQAKSDAFFNACSYGDIRTVKSMIKSNPGLVNTPNESGWFPIHDAAQQGQTAVVIELLKAGANINARTGFKTTPLQYAVMSHHIDTGKALLARGADPNIPDDVGTASLHRAIQHSYYDYAELLIKNGADVNLRIGHYPSPLEYAGDDKRMVKLLKKYGAK